MIRAIKKTVYLCTCERCGNEWKSLLPEPKRCARCRTPLWNIKKKPKTKIVRSISILTAANS